MSEKPKTLEQKLVNFLFRAARRKRIAESSDLRETIDELKRPENKEELFIKMEQQTAEFMRLMNETLTVPEQELIDLLDAMLPELQKKFPFIKALILQGSGAHGGAFIRDSLGDQIAHDLDWGVFLEMTDELLENESNRGVNPTEATLRGEIVEEGNSIIDQLRKSKPELFEKLPDNFRSCEVSNPKLSFFYDVAGYSGNIDSVRMFQLLEPTPVEHRKLPMYRELSCFFPTIPAEVGLRNREIFLQHLSELSISDHSRWEEYTRVLKWQWKSKFELIPKYFDSNRTRDTKAFRSLIVWKLNNESVKQELCKSFDEMIDNTDLSEKS